MITTPDSPREGIYYVGFTPFGWEPATKCFEPGEDIDHATWWDEELASSLAHSWQKTLGVRPRKMTPRFCGFPYAFPRGRVTRTAGGFLVHHGADLHRSMKVPKRLIEMRFGISGKCGWLFDEHEQCQKGDQEAVCGLLGIEPWWSAV